MKLGAYIDITELTKQMAAGNVSARKHPKWPLTILNYTTTAMGQTHDNQTLRRCRGLIYDHETMDIIARPMEGFFNVNDERYPETNVNDITRLTLPKSSHWGLVSDLHQPPLLPRMEVTEKMDGSMGIIYQYKDNPPEVATRGSFESEQAKWATDFLRRRTLFGNCLSLKSGCVVCEIIYPGNQIVVDYGDRADLTMITAIDNETGAEPSHLDLAVFAALLPLRVVPLFDKTPLQCMAENTRNAEGYVIKVIVPGEATPRRFKAKFSDYVLAHRAMYGIHNRDVWEVLASGKEFNLEPLKAFCPPGLLEWLSQTSTDFKFRYRKIDEECRAVVAEAQGVPILTRKEVAEFFKRHDTVNVAGRSYNVFPVLFCKFDSKYDKTSYSAQGKPCTDPIWRLLRPQHAQGYKGVTPEQAQHVGSEE